MTSPASLPILDGVMMSLGAAEEIEPGHAEFGTFEAKDFRGHRQFKGIDGVVSAVAQIVDNSRQSRSRRPGSVRRVSVPSAFRHVISPGVARKVSRVGTSPLGPALAPPLSHVCSFADGPGLPVFAGVPLWQASPPRPLAGEGVCVTSATWCGLRRRLFLRLPMPLAIKRAMHIL